MSSLLDVSPELHLSIIFHLSLSDKRCLRLVNGIFNNLLIFELPLEELRAARKAKTIFLIDGAGKGEFGFEPFIIPNARKIHEESEPATNTGATHSGDEPVQPPVRREKIMLDIYRPKFMRNDNEDRIPEENEWEIPIHMAQLSLSSRTKLSPESPRLTKSVDYALLRGKLIKASAAHLRSRFVCGECGNGREVCPGCGGFSRRFSDLFTNCGWSMPCPVCIGYGVADHAKYIQDDEENLNKLWTEINSMLNGEKNPVQRRRGRD